MTCDSDVKSIDIADEETSGYTGSRKVISLFHSLRYCDENAKNGSWGGEFCVGVKNLMFSEKAILSGYEGCKCSEDEGRQLEFSPMKTTKSSL